MFQDLRAEIRYRLDDIFSRSWLSQFVLLVLLSLVVVLIGMTAYFFGLFSARNRNVEGVAGQIDEGVWDSLWWSLKHLLDPGFFGNSYGASVPVVVISLFVAIMGMVIFGILIGFISTSMESRLAALQKGDSPVRESGHTLILGWNNKIGFLLRMLARSRQVSRVVVLARSEIAHMQETVRAEGLLKLPFKLVLRSGSPGNLFELKRVALEHAGSVIVLSGWTRDADSSGRDVEAIKTAMLLSSFSEWRGARPILVTEINRKQNVEIARIASHGAISVVSSSEVISKVIVQAARQSGVSVVYSEILSGDGNSLCVRQFPACVGKRFGDVQYGFADAIPVGVCWRQEDDGVERFAAGLNPEPDYTIAEDDQLVLLSSSGQVSFDIHKTPHVSGIGREEKYRRQSLDRILVLGFNDNVYDIVSEFDGHVTPGTRIDIVSGFGEDEARERLDRYATRELRHVRINCRRGDTVSAGFLRSLDVRSYDCIITLADESNDDDSDARSIMVLLLLTDIIGAQDTSKPIQIVSELHDPRNRELVARTVARDVIVSPEIVSMQLSQISQNRILESIYRELLSAGGTEICLKPASRYVELRQPCCFYDLQCSAQAKMEVALGIRINGNARTASASHGVQLNPRRDATWQFDADDSVVVLAQELYD